MHKTYQDLIVHRAAAMVGAAKALQGINHSGLKGQLREVVVRELLKPLLPPEFILGSGEIVCSDGSTSNQTDALIADGRILPAMLIDQTSGVFPLEAVLMTIEIKSTLNSTELKAAHEAATKITSFKDKYAPPVSKAMYPPERSIEHVVPYILAFDTDLAVNGTDDLARYNQILKGNAPSILGICVVGRGFWFRHDSTWIQWDFKIPYGEIVGFVTSVVNSTQRIASTRLQPDLRSYVV